MEVLKNSHEEFVTVVSVGNSNPDLDNFVTVLSIGNGTEKQLDTGVDNNNLKRSKIDVDHSKNGADIDENENKDDEINGLPADDGYTEEEVDVFRLPGERLGFGLKFEGGNKTSEKVRKLFVQSCASESPASRATCSWGTLGEGDEVLSIDGVPVTEMTRLDCVRRLKESQLVIKLLVRYRGALRPEVVSAELKSPTDDKKNKIPPELPSGPPPVPPRKLRQPRGPADGEANPSPVRKPWDSPKSNSSSVSASSTSSITETPVRSINGLSNRELSTSSSKSTSYESCNSSPGSKFSSKNSSPKNSNNANSNIVVKQQSPDLNKCRQDLPEATIYLDARSHDGCSNQGSTSDDTGSSMSTVIDCRLSSSDRFSTISTISSTASDNQQQTISDNNLSTENYQKLEESTMDISADENIDLVRLLAPFDQLEREFRSNPPTTDYLLSRLANSEAVTFVEALGDGDGLVERVTAVVAPNTVLIEETITLQPPLSFQDAPLSYGHETRPGLVFTDLAADSTTHFRPIKDDALIVDCVNGNVDQVIEGPPLPARNHVRRINVNQDGLGDAGNCQDNIAKKISLDLDVSNDAPALPPKPMPRKDVKSKRKRPPPPPPPPRRDVQALTNLFGEEEVGLKEELSGVEKVEESYDDGDEKIEALVSEDKSKDAGIVGDEIERNNERNLADSQSIETNKMMEIIEMRKAKALIERSKRNSDNDNEILSSDVISGKKDSDSDPLLIINDGKVVETGMINDNESVDHLDKKNNSINDKNENVIGKKNNENEKDEKGNESMIKNIDNQGTYKSLDEVRDELKISDVNRSLRDEDEDSTDESDADSYYWQSNLATIGEEEETNSLEFTNTNRSSDSDEGDPANPEKLKKFETDSAAAAAADGDEVDCLRRDCSGNISDATSASEQQEVEKQSSDKSPVNGRMENCGGGQRLPPDGDEFPATYQEFSSQQQYQFVAGSRVSSTLGSNSDNNILTGGGDNSEVKFTTSETFKLIQTEKKNSSLLLNDSNSKEKIILVQDKSRLINLKTNHPADITVRSEIKIPIENSTRKMTGIIPIEDYSQYNGSVTTNEKGLVVSEKKIKISSEGYSNGNNNSLAKNESVDSTINEFNKESSPPPPLPTSRPPKIEVQTPSSQGGGIARGLSRSNLQPQHQPHRKFSLNCDLWRQDDKSEKSVRDKIAMFSSQSSLEVPLFPSIVSTQVIVQNVLPTTRRLSKYKSSEDVFADEPKLLEKDKSDFNERTRSSFDLSTSLLAEKYDSVPPSLPLTSPPGSPRSKINSSFISPLKIETDIHTQISKPITRHSISSLEFKSLVPSIVGSSANGNSSNETKNGLPLKATTSYIGPAISSSTNLSRATSFSGGSTSSLHSRSQSLSDIPPMPQISRTNSLASTFRRASEDMRRTSLNQLIEQRRKGISKLRGLVIPEKEAIPVSQSIVDLPEIKSRDSIILQQVPRANIHDKWGSQSSISSSISTTSVPGKITTSFKMPEPQNLPKYSPAFKRKSLTVYGNSVPTAITTMTTSTTVKNSPASEAPKSLESICSPTRSDFSFEYVPTSGSPRSRANLRKARTDYDDSDNDSAVSSSQSSISRGFSPPVSPVPSERSTLSSERSYLSAETTNSVNFHVGESRAVTLERSQFTTRPSYHSEVSSSSSSSPDPRSPQQSDIYSRNSLHHNPLKRSSSTDTNCSTSSTLTSGSQASAESLSRRVLKPQSVEAINRKNILASARCRSGRDLNGSPLIQRKFSDDEEAPVSKLAQENGSCGNGHKASNGNEVKTGDVKIAYIDVTEPFTANYNKDEEERAEKTEDIQPSNELKKWVRAEIKTLINSPMENKQTEQKKVEIEVQVRSPRRRSSLVNNEEKSSSDSLFIPRSRSSFVETEQTTSFDNSKSRSRSSLALETKNNDSQNDLLTVLATKSRSRSTIHIEERSLGRSRSQMSLEEILDGKVAEEPSPASLQINSGRSWIKEKGFNSKIPTPERLKLADKNEEDSPNAVKDIQQNQKIISSRIPTSRSLGRRSASVTDMKKAIEKSDQCSSGIGLSQGHNYQAATTNNNTHSRFPSLDSSGMDESNHRIVCGDIESERYSASEQFGSITSLASSTSLISQQELAQLVEDATSEEPKGAHDVIVVLYHKENPAGSVGIALAGGVDCETKEITVHRVLAHSIADKDGRVQRGDRILSINGRSTKGLSHRESLAVLKQPRSEVVLVVSRTRDDITGRLRSRTENVETIVEGPEMNGTTDEQTAWGPPATVSILKDGAGLGFSLEGGRDSPLGDRPLIVKKIFAGGAAEKTGALRAGDQMLDVNGNDVTKMSRIEAWSLMKKLNDGEVRLLVRHPATKSSS